MDAIFAAEAARTSGGDGYWHLAMILAAIGLLGVFARLRRKNARQPMTAQDYRDMDRNPDRYRGAADKAMVELLETASDLTADVNTKCRVLNRLVKDAEAQAARLEALIAQASGIDAAAIRPVAAAVPPPADASGTETDPAETPRRQPAPASGGSEIINRVAVLRDQGKTVGEIAKATNLSTIEVTFALESLSAASSSPRGAAGGDQHGE